jgi:hypothetical protein
MARASFWLRILDSKRVWLLVETPPETVDPARLGTSRTE